MIFKKNRHYCTPFPWPTFYSIWPGQTLKTEMLAVFDESIRYDLGSDQNDVNKLFGHSYGFHHVNSDRIGFRYNPYLDNVEIVLYSYVDGKRVPTAHIDNVEIGERVRLGMYVDIWSWATTEKSGIKRVITAFVEREDGNNNKCIHKSYSGKNSTWGYSLGGYFGGNRRAPHKITIKC